MVPSLHDSCGLQNLGIFFMIYNVAAFFLNPTPFVATTFAFNNNNNNNKIEQPSATLQVIRNAQQQS